MKWPESSFIAPEGCEMRFHGDGRRRERSQLTELERRRRGPRDAGKQEQQPRCAHLIYTLLGHTYGPTLVSTFTPG